VPPALSMSTWCGAGGGVAGGGGGERDDDDGAEESSAGGGGGTSNGGGGGGGDAQDDDEPALCGLLSAFRDASRLPASVLRAGSGGGEPSVARGSSLAFERLPGGRVLARCVSPSPDNNDGEAGGGGDGGNGDVVTTLADVTSPALARALFGLYLADQPVSQKAKATAAESLARLSSAAAPERGGTGGGGGGGRWRGTALYRPSPRDRVVCELELSPLDEEDGGHDACVLVPAYE
jgi:hypothetical protein